MFLRKPPYRKLCRTKLRFKDFTSSSVLSLLLGFIPLIFLLGFIPLICFLDFDAPRGGGDARDDNVDDVDDGNRSDWGAEGSEDDDKAGPGSASGLSLSSSIFPERNNELEDEDSTRRICEGDADHPEGGSCMGNCSRLGGCHPPGEGGRREEVMGREKMGEGMSTNKNATNCSLASVLSVKRVSRT